MQEIPPHLQHQIMQLQQLQQRLEMLVAQKSQMEIRMKEAEKALSELEKLSEGAIVYKNVGTILVKSQKDKVKEELVDKKDTLEMRLKTIQRQEERTRQQFEEARTKIQSALQRPGTKSDLGTLGPM
ncbi:MAG: prefoldin subunit beta [Candidatus Helarchaeota archaeon]|nr:prefoldin subunit beta [Candidatus Helarchaeota archaeon]